MYQRILIATDSSPWTDAAVEYALTLATYPGTELFVLTVLPTFLAWGQSAEGPGSIDFIIETVERHSAALLDRVVDSAVHLGVSCKPICRWGAVAETILHTASVEKCDLIILGSRQVNGWKRRVLGGTCNAVATKASQPVLIVKQPPQLTYECPLWRRLLVATDESRSSDAAVAHAITLAQTEAVELHVLHVEPRPQLHGDNLVMPCSEGERVLIVTEARTTAAGVVSEPCLATGHITTTIIETASNRQCEVIILGSRGLTGWKRLMVGSIANAVAARSTLPVLIVKPS